MGETLGALVRAGLMALSAHGTGSRTPASRTARVDRIFNRRLTDRQPAAVVPPASPRPRSSTPSASPSERGWQVAVRSGGHSWAQWSVRTDALVIDLGGLKEIVVRRGHRQVV